MAKPILKIGTTDYTDHILEITPSGNGLNADGSGRDTQTGEMLRTKIADKLKIEVKMDRLYEDVHQMLVSALKETYYQATVLDPDTNTQVTKTFYTDTRPFGSQRYDKDRQKTYYDGVSFSMTEK